VLRGLAILRETPDIRTGEKNPNLTIQLCERSSVMAIKGTTPTLPPPSRRFGVALRGSKIRNSHSD